MCVHESVGPHCAELRSSHLEQTQGRKLFPNELFRLFPVVLLLTLEESRSSLKEVKSSRKNF